jgi:hypothetical protein
VSYAIGGDSSVALLGLGALRERGKPIEADGRQIEQKSFIEMELQTADGDYAWDTGRRFVSALAELNNALRGKSPGL